MNITQEYNQQPNTLIVYTVQYIMRYKYTKRISSKPFVTIVQCINCDAVATSEDIEYGCARCESYGTNDISGWYKPE
jgi:hypothetical protein